jgi:hypothetical protein
MELKRAAELTEAYYGGHLAIQDVQTALPREGWLEHRQYLAGLLHDKPIWQELQEAEAALDATKQRGAAPPAADLLRGLVVRLQFEAGSQV